jgi:hypothetical protein
VSAPKITEPSGSAVGEEDPDDTIHLLDLVSPAELRQAREKHCNHNGRIVLIGIVRRNISLPCAVCRGISFSRAKNLW